jgi:hypothetical protein
VCLADGRRKKFGRQSSFVAKLLISATVVSNPGDRQRYIEGGGRNLGDRVHLWLSC